MYSWSNVSKLVITHRMSTASSTVTSGAQVPLIGESLGQSALPLDAPALDHLERARTASGSSAHIE